MKYLQTIQFLIVVVLVLANIFFSPCYGHYGPFFKNVKYPGPTSTMTKGEPWPKPQIMNTIGTTFKIIRPFYFRFEIKQNSCDILEQALKRYYSIILLSNGLNINNPTKGFNYNLTRSNNNNNNNGVNYTWKYDRDFYGYLDVVEIDVLTPCEDNWPHENMDESYEISIDTQRLDGKGFLVARTIWGMLRALETFSQILYPTADYVALKVRTTIITDFPRFSYRSILLDTSRHFIPKHIIFKNLDLMSMNKYNVFHWHIVDSQAFPYQSHTFPELSNKGAYHPYTHVYSRSDIQEIIEYARLRGIRVIPEFDTPGHTLSWGLSQPELLTTCYNETTGLPDGSYGPIDPTNNITFIFLKEFFKEVIETFPDKYLHLGGDEVDSTCWESNPKIQDFMKMMNFSQDFTKLQNFYTQNLINILENISKKNKSYLVWQEVFDNNVDLNTKTIIHVWKSNNLTDELYNITNVGYRVVFSSCWYLDYISYGVDWHKYYICDPQNFNGSLIQQNLILGGGPAMWCEMVDETNLIPRLWPRASVPAERLWSNKNVNDTVEAEPRLEEHRCRLLKRGFRVEPPNGSGYCPTVLE